jgi:hypothetical protein
MTKKQKERAAAKKLKDKIKQYQITHKRHGCYEVVFVDNSKEIGKFTYLTNFRNKKAVKEFVEQHARGNVTIDPETCIPTPDFK